MKTETRILGLMIRHRVKDASQMQNIFTKYGCNIKTRLGLHEVNENMCGPSGLVLLEIVGNTVEMDSMEAEIKTVEGIELQKMVFSV